MNIDIICVSRMKAGPHLDLIQDYKKRMRWTINILEIDHKKDNENSFQKLIKPGAIIVAMDEKGQNLKSLELAKKIEGLQSNHFQFLIGGADGLPKTIRSQANFSLSFGKLTWPHMLARVMLLEQLYRAQQILAGHPYHRE